MEAGLPTTTLTIDPQKFLEKYNNTFPNMREIARGAIDRGMDIRVEFIVGPLIGQFTPLSAMPTVKDVRP